MKNYFYIILFLIFLPFTSYGALNMTLTGIMAKKAYQYLTSNIQTEGAAGHFYRKGKNIICRYTNADMTDNHGNHIPHDDARRYHCEIKMTHSGCILKT